jgi:hypothetical protein
MFAERCQLVQKQVLPFSLQDKLQLNENSIVESVATIKMWLIMPSLPSSLGQRIACSTSKPPVEIALNYFFASFEHLLANALISSHKSNSRQNRACPRGLEHGG